MKHVLKKEGRKGQEKEKEELNGRIKPFLLVFILVT